MIPALLLSSALTLAPAGSGAAAAPFAAAYCPYTIQFPSDAPKSESAPAGGSRIATAELLAGNTRLSVFCASTPAASPASPLAADERKARILELVNGLGISQYAIKDVGAPDCAEVDGTLAAQGATYRILSRLCFRGDSTFIAEAVFGAAADETLARSFLASMRESGAAPPNSGP